MTGLNNINSFQPILHDFNELLPKEDPFQFVSKILDMSLELQMEIFPEVGSTENIFKYYTYEEVKKRYSDWYKGYISTPEEVK